MGLKFSVAIGVFLFSIANIICSLFLYKFSNYLLAIFYILGVEIVLASVFCVYLRVTILTPLKNLLASMLQLASGEATTLPEFESTPREIIALRNVFIQFATKASDAHAHDVEVSQVKSDFISTAAHQLRTPLTGIRWALEALEKESLSEEQKALVANAVSKSHDLVSVVGTLLDISSIESGKYTYSYNLADITKIVEGVVRDFQHLAREAQIQLSYIPGSTDVPPILMDAERIKWILNNLVENAIRYTPVEGSVSLRIVSDARSIQVLIRDTGIGISAEDKNNIFERFFRAGNAITKENKGSGLGLYIAKRIANDHGGDLVFAINDNTPGTTFRLSLPIVT